MQQADHLSDDGTASSQRNSTAIHPGENGIIWTLWFTYGAFYFCRTNISAAVPGLKASAAEGGLGLSGTEVGWILASLKIAYALGQLVNGQLSERTSPRVMLALGMFGSAALNVVFGFSTGFYFLLFVWATNGFCQSLGWTPCVRVAANWVPILRRGNALGIIGTGYQITLGLTYLIAGQSAELLGWRGAFYVPAVLLTLAGCFMLLTLRESPHDSPLPRDNARNLSSAAVRPSLSQSLYWTLYNPALWLLGLSLGLLNACRYGYLDWGLAHLMDSQQVRIDKAALQFFVIAIGAAAGSYLAGWGTDRFFGGRRAPMIFLLMTVLGGLSLVYDPVVRHSIVGTILLLIVVGFCIYGPQVLLVGTAPADLAYRGTSAAAAGFVNFMGYMGAATGDVVTGYYSSADHGGWRVAIYIWGAWAFAGAAIMVPLWNMTSKKVTLFPGSVPRIGAVITMSVACLAATYGDHPTALKLAAYVGAACFVAAALNRSAATAGLVLATGGLLAEFAFYANSAQTAWHQNLAMLAYGLTILAGLMILVERKDTLCE